jgi:hypothetical protein
MDGRSDSQRHCATAPLSKGPALAFSNRASGPAARGTPAARRLQGQASKGRKMTNSKPSRPTTKVEPIDESRLSEDLSRRIDAWIAAQPEPRPTRSEAIRRLLNEALGMKVEAARPVITDEAALPEIPKSDSRTL